MAANTSIYTQDVRAGVDIWMPSTTTVWEQATVLAVSSAMATVRTESDDVVQLDLLTIPVYLANPTLQADVTALHYIHEPGILYNLEQRSGENLPYTLLGSVLVAVNPLRKIPDPAGICGQKSAAQHPHPYGIAEIAFSQLVFAENRKLGGKKTEEEIISNQSIVISGESGSGKTESSKYVLEHLVARNAAAGGQSDIDNRLLGSNPILESFGNASTLRNHNSSRFGKFLKLHFKGTPRAGDTTAWTIGGASVQTYLLERSRITSHNNGERGYHIFYQLRDGSPAAVKEQLGLHLNAGQFKYLTPREDVKIPASATKMKVNDQADYADMSTAWAKLGISDQVKDAVFQTLAGILHLGNVEFLNEERAEGNVAVIKPGGYGALEWAGRLLGVNADGLGLIFREHEVKAGAEMVTKRRDAGAASYARDATAKALYCQLFEWVVDEINSALEASSGTKVDTLPYIGVLDIFGFESFERNDFEQLLINYTNETLQGTFNKQVFVAEMELYKREGLIVGDGGMQMPPDNSDCMALLAGAGKQQMGLLRVIDAESATPQANDLKMCKQLHRAFEKAPCFLKPHPKDIASTFIIRHYAGAIIYTVGRFVEKNVDRLPQEVAKTFEASTVSVVSNLFTIKGDKAAAAKRAFGGASILGKFSAQITDLVRTLESTRDSFIRCVKPNPAMVRGEDLSWFDRRYVTQQLKCLSIPQTAEVLKSGLPTRVPYEVLLDSYRSVLPQEAISIWQRLGGGDPKGFMTALFWAFNVPEDAYRTGTTRVFFKSGELTTLDRIMESAGKWVNSSDAAAVAEKEAVVKRFKFFYIRALWRKAIIKTIVCNHMTTIYHAVHGREEAAKKLQAMERMYAQKKQFNRTKRGAIMAQKMWRAKKARQLAAKLRQEAIEEAKRKAIEAKRLEEEARIRAEAEAKAAEEARIQAEKEAEAAKAKADAKAMQEAQDKMAAMKAAEAARAQKAEEEAARLKADRERLEEDERRKKEDDEVRRVQEDKEQQELEARFRREEAERMAQEEVAAKAKSLGLPAPAKQQQQQRKKSVVREMRKSVVGVTRQEKDQKIRLAEDGILAERTVFGNSGKNGWLQKMEKSGLFGTRKPKALFCMLRMVGFELEIYQKAASNGLVGEPKGKPYKSFKFNKHTTCRALQEDKKLPLGAYVFEIGDVKHGAIQLGCANDAERKEWMEAFLRAQRGFSPSQQASNKLKDAQALQVVGGGAAEGGAGSPEDDFDVTTLPMEAQEQIAKIESLYETGLLTKEEMDQLRPIIIQQGREQMATNEDEEYDVFPTGDAPRRQTQMGATHGKNAFRPTAHHTNAHHGMGYDQDGGAGSDAMVVCDVCSILNMHGGNNCLVCNAALPKANDPVQQTKVRHHRESMQVVAPLHAGGEFGPAGGKWLCQLPFRSGGTFKCFVKDCASVMDQQTWSQTALYILGCEFTQGMIYQEQWTARHNWHWFEKWHKKAVEVGLVPAGGPSFPQVDAVEATSTKPATMNKLKDLLAKFMGDLFAHIKDSETFLAHDLADKMFKIRDNVQQELDFDTYEQIYKEVLSADMSSADSSVPLTREEMEIADDAGTLLITFIRGDGTTKAIDIFDERVQDLHSVCVAAVPRLRASQDVDNHLVILELVPHALDVLEHLEKCLNTYNDTLSIAQNKLVMM